LHTFADGYDTVLINNPIIAFILYTIISEITFLSLFMQLKLLNVYDVPQYKHYAGNNFVMIFKIWLGNNKHLQPFA